VFGLFFRLFSEGWWGRPLIMLLLILLSCTAVSSITAHQQFGVALTYVAVIAMTLYLISERIYLLRKANSQALVNSVVGIAPSNQHEAEAI
jgi:hypothetical protein